MTRSILALACLFAIFVAGAASAAILNVPGDYATIQAAIDAAAVGDEIVIAAGSYASEAFIDHGGFTIRGTGEVILGPSSGGIAFICSLDADYLPVIFEHLTFEGFAIGISYDMDFAAEIRDCVFRLNENGIHGCGDGPLILRDCLFEDNHATWAGGAISSCGAVLDVADCVFRNNTAGVMGGAIFSDTPFGPRSFSNCLFVGNDAPKGAAVQVEFGGPVDFSRCTFHANGRSGAAVLNVEMASSTLNLSRCIVTGSPGSAFSCTDGGVLNISCTDAWNNAEGDWTDCAAGQLGVDGNFSADPLYCDLANGDFAFDADSPCAPGGNACGVTIGAYGVGCGLTAAEENSFSAVKSLY